jgi:hypothetical protein
MAQWKSAVTTAMVVVAGVVAGPRTARAQGCVLIRQNGPLPGQWEFSFSTRTSTADKHYNGDVEQSRAAARDRLASAPGDMAAPTTRRSAECLQ